MLSVNYISIKLEKKGKCDIYMCVCVYIYTHTHIPQNGILFSHKKEQNNAICRDMDGPRDCQSEVSQKEKNKYRILTHVCGT